MAYTYISKKKFERWLTNVKQLDKLMRQPPGYDRSPDDGDVADRVKAAIRDIRSKGGWGVITVSVKAGRPSTFTVRVDDRL